MTNSADRNLLFAILALQMDFISRDQLVAGMNAWVLEKSKPLGHILVEQKVLRVDLHAALETMVEKHLEMHGRDAAKSLAAWRCPATRSCASSAGAAWVWFTKPANGSSTALSPSR